MLSGALDLAVGPGPAFEDLETAAPEDAAWREKPAVGTKEFLNICRLEISNVLAGGGLRALILQKAGNLEDANWSYGDSCGPHGILKYVRPVQIISSGAVELAGGHRICRNLKAGGPEKVKWLCM